MQRHPTRQSRSVLSLVLALACFLSGGDPAFAQGSRLPNTWVEDDFGPPPEFDARDAVPRGSFGSNLRTFSRDDIRHPGGYGSRDPARMRTDDLWDLPDLPRSLRTRAFPDDFRLPAGRDEFDSFIPNSRTWSRDAGPTSVPRDWMREDFRVPRDNYRLPRTAPTEREQQPERIWDRPRAVPTAPALPAQPTFREKVAKRYQDPRVVRVMQQLTPQSGEALYIEISQLIDSRHVAPTSYQQRVRGALEHLTVALETPAFQQAAGLVAPRQNLELLKEQLAAYGRQMQAQNLSHAVNALREVGQMTRSYVQMNPAVVSLAFVYGALDTLDEYSMFVAPEKSGAANLGLKENMVGIGVEIESHPLGVKILKALAGGPAAEATLRRGDIITAVDGRSLAGLDLSQVADLIGGRAGTPIKLDLKRDNLVGDVTLVRRPFQVRSVSEARMETADVGYIKLDQFSESSTKELDAALWTLHQQGMQSLILDLRGNPGGLLTAAIEISDRFLPAGTIVSTRGRTAADNSEEKAQYAQTWKVPLVVLIDHDSASASEIFAAAIQENRRGWVVGTPSYGKGTVQTLFPLKSAAGALRLTTGKFYSPEGREMAGVGVQPDISVATSRTSNETNDRALQKALEIARDPRLIDMANQLARTGRTGLRVIKVAA
jgi:carboxyl-terminal processing protease